MCIWNMWAIKEMWRCSCWKEVCARSCMEMIIPTRGHLQYSPCSLVWSSPSGGKQADPKTSRPLVMAQEGTFRMAASAQIPQKTRGDVDSKAKWLLWAEEMDVGFPISIYCLASEGSLSSVIALSVRLLLPFLSLELSDQFQPTMSKM